MGKRSGRRKKKGINYSLILILVLALLVIFSAALYFGGLGAPLSPEEKEYVQLTIAMGTATSNIGNFLEEEGIIQSAKKFKLYAKLKGYDGKLKAGDYLFSPSMNLKEIMGMMAEGSFDTVRFTVPEGLTLKQVAEKLEKDGLVGREDFLYELEHGDFDFKYIPFLPPGPNRLEGFLMPNTYDINKGADAHTIINTMLAQFDKVYKDEYYAKATEMGYDLNQIVTLASMIERETRVELEREIVAGVIYNRLNSGMKLQIDATVQYALGEWKDRLLNRDLEIDSPYNTYKVAGLPIGPICSPGENSIIAALYPQENDYFYYVLDASLNGSHRFSNDYNTFLKNKADYLKAMEGR